MTFDWSVDDDRLLAVFVESPTPAEPRTTAAVAAAVDADEEAIEDRLRTLVDRGELQTTVVSGSRVWWRPHVAAGPPNESRDQRLDRTTQRLNRLFREITNAVLEQSTQDEIEHTLCTLLADSELYTAAWFGEFELHSEEITSHTRAGDPTVFTPTAATDVDPVGQSAAKTAADTDELTVADDSCCHHLDDCVERCVAIPIVDKSTQYGVIGIGTDRPAAFDRDERDILEELGAVVGHAIAASQRQRALLNDELVELSFLVEDISAHFDCLDNADGRLSYTRSVPIADGGFLVYGTATGGSIRTLETLVDSETVDHWESMTTLSTDGETTQFELTFSEHPVLSTVTALGGRIHEATIEDGTFHMTFHFAPNTEIQAAINSVKTIYPSARIVRRNQTVPPDRSLDTSLEPLSSRLTDCQSAVLKSAYEAGFFNWPRDCSGETVADSLGISPATFHQHLRKAQAILLETLFESESTDR